MRGKAEFLLHHGDAKPVSVVRRQQGGPPIDQDFPAVGRERARQQIDEGALAGAVLAEESMDAAGNELDRDVAERLIAEERLRNVARFENRLPVTHDPRRAALPARRRYFFKLLAISSSNSLVS